MRTFTVTLLSLFFRRGLLMALLSLGLSTQAQTTWTGTTSTDWATPGNWSGNAVPTDTSNVVIPSGPANQPTLSTAGAVAGTVHVQSGAKLTIASAGSLTINGFIPVSPSTTSFYNQGTVENSGQLTLGTTASVGNLGLFNQGSFINKPGGQLAIDRSADRALFQQGGTFTNEGAFTIGANASVGQYGIFNNGGAFANKPGGQIAIDSASLVGVFQAGDTFTNEGRITIGAIASVGKFGMNNIATFVNKPGGQITIDRTTEIGLINSLGAFTNEGRITLGAIASVGSQAVDNKFRATFNNSGCTALLNIVADAFIGNTSNVASTFINSGTILENATANSSITSNSGIVVNRGGGTFSITTNTGLLTTTAGTIWTGCTSTDWATSDNWLEKAVPTDTSNVVIPSGPANQPTLSTAGAVARTVHVQSGAKLTIASVGSLSVNGFKSFEDATVGFINQGTVENSGRLALGTTASVGDFGLLNLGTFTNQSGGQLAIDRAVNRGLFHQSGTFTNWGSITIGAIASVGTYGLYNLSTFNNSGCTALLNIGADAVIFNSGGILTNSGLLLENATGTSSISANTGIVVNQNGGPFDVGNGPNQPLAVVVTDATRCAPANGAIQLTGLKASTPYTLRYALNGGSPVLLSPDSTSMTTGTLTIPGLGVGSYALTLSGSCVPLPLQLEATLTGPTPGVQGKPTLGGVPACAGQPVTVTFRADCGDALTAQLSDAAGNFDNPVSLGSVTPGQSQVTLPVGTPTGSGYRIRVVSTTPALTSEVTDAFRVTALSVALFTAMPGRICQGDPLPITFSTTGNCSFPQGNVFTVQLSNASGSFANPTVLGTANPGTASFALPSNLPLGTGYRVRVLSSQPQTSAVSVPFRLEGPSLAATPGVAGAPVCRGQAIAVTFNVPAGSCAFPQDNAFTAQLSSATGSFASPTLLGPVLAGVSNSLTIPATVAAGSGYRIRLVSSSSPALVSQNSAPFRVNACTNRQSTEEAELVVSPNPVRGGEIRVRVNGMDNPQFNLTTSTGQPVGVSAKTNPESSGGGFVLTPTQALTLGAYVLQASEGTIRLTRRVLVAE